MSEDGEPLNQQKWVSTEDVTYKIKVQAVCASHEVEKEVRGRKVSIIVISLHGEASVVGLCQSRESEGEYIVGIHVDSEF